MGKYSFFILSILLCASVEAQVDTLSLSKTLKIKISDLPKKLDSLPVYPSSIEYFLDGEVLKSTLFSYEFGKLSLSDEGKKRFETSDLIEVHYQTLSANLGIGLQRINPSKIQKGDEQEFIAFDFTPSAPQSGLIDMKGLNYEGSFSRGVSFGNAQNLVLNSNFNLRFGGIVGDDLEITAAISDQNIPLQPEGNTQQLQDFDKVFMEIKKDDWKLIAGDYELNRPKGYFQNYFKKLQGANVSQSSIIGEKTKLTSTAAAAIARGKFARNVITPLEGNQGPYRLRGNQGERFLIVLSGTEKVYIDGVLMSRGLENDYTIDYNRSEVTFSQKRLITKDIRIIVEFEYSDQNYLRSVVAASSQFETEKANVYLNIYSEQDSKQRGAVLELDDQEKVALNTAGDQQNRASVSGIDTIEAFNEFTISYKLIDTTFCNGLDTQYLAYSTNPDSALYTARFLNIGQGNGNYIQDLNTAANGRVYVFVPPDPITCLPQGSFEPIKLLTAPNLLQMVSLGGNVKLGNNFNLFSEASISKNDLNRFSSVDSEDDVGFANKTGITFEKKLGDSTSSWQMFSEASLEYVQANFRSLNPYRSAEFNREWNLTSNNTGARNDTTFNQRSNEQIPAISLGIRNGNKFKLSYQSEALLREKFYQGFRQTIDGKIKQKGLIVDANLSFLTSDGLKEKTIYERPTVNISQTIKKLNDLKIGAFGLREWNQRRLADTDSLELNSFGFNEYKLFIASEEKEKLGYRISYGQRQDFAALGNELSQSTLANNLELSGKWMSGKTSTLKWNAHMRQLFIKNENLTNLDPKNTLLGRVEHRLNLLKGAFINSLNYEIGSGQEPLVEYRYLEVQPGEGIYFWDPVESDFNGDNVPQIDEIQEAPLQGQGNVQRISLFTDEFIQTNNNRLNLNLRFDPRRLWNKRKGFLKGLSKFSIQSNLQIDRKIKESPGVQVWNPFQLAIPDSSLVTLNLSTQHTLFYRPLGTKLDVRVGQRQRGGRTLLTTGFDARDTQSWFTRIRWNLNAKFSAGLESSIDEDSRDVEFFNRQDYDIQSYLVEPNFTYRPNADLRIILGYLYKNSQNAQILGGESAEQQDLNLEVTFNQSSKTSIRLKTTAAVINYSGAPRTPLELVILDGLKDGQNYLWELSLNRNLTENILMTVNYNGRKTGSSNIVHIGTVQIGARF